VSTALIRAYRVLQESGLSGQVPERVTAARNNEVWFAGAHVLRISALSSSDRLSWEAEVAEVLPDRVPHARVVARGTNEFGGWMVSRRVPGWPLTTCWPDLTNGQRQDAIHQLGAALETLHACPGPLDPDGQPAVPPFLRDWDSLECPHQLPPSRLLALLERCRRLRGVDPGLMDAAGFVVRECAGALAGERPRGLVHGDLHLQNVLWDPSTDQLTAILDFEWSRLAPADLDLDVLLRFCGDASHHLGRDEQQRLRTQDFLAVPTWLREQYPALFEHPRLQDRLRLYALAYDIPQLLADPPRVPVQDLPEHHAYHRIRRVVEGRTHAGWALV
jgi:aminoglycoside phosphotransferase (APT) family kinase protein